MSKKLSILFLIFSAFLFISCNNSQSANANANKKSPAKIQKGVVPVADNEIAVIEMEEPAFGTIKIELYSNVAPKMVARFKELANEGVYNGVTFHRINNSVIQSGDPNTKDNNPANDGLGASDKPNVESEFSDLQFDTTIVGAARSQDEDSANSQFFITLKREAGFDNRYTIFGKVIEGMNNAVTIAGAPKEGERPTEDIKIKQITFQPRQ